MCFQLCGVTSQLQPGIATMSTRPGVVLREIQNLRDSCALAAFGLSTMRTLRHHFGPHTSVSVVLTRINTGIW